MYLYYSLTLLFILLLPVVVDKPGISSLAEEIELDLTDESAPDTRKNEAQVLKKISERGEPVWLMIIRCIRKVLSILPYIGKFYR